MPYSRRHSRIKDPNKVFDIWTILLIIVIVATALSARVFGDPPDLDSIRARAAQLVQPEPSPEPVPAAELEQRPSLSIRFEERTVQAQSGPLCVLVSGSNCAPCAAAHRDLSDLEASGAIVTVDVNDPEGLAQYGITRPTSIPRFYGFSPTTGSYSLEVVGYASRERLIQDVVRAGFSLEAPQTKPAEFSEAIVSGPPSTQGVVQALALHIGRQQENVRTSALMGSFFDVELDVPDATPDILRSLTWTQEWSVGGLNIKWAGKRTAVFEPGKLTFSPASSVTLNKWRLKVTVALNGITVTEDGKVVTLDLSGVPDLIVRFK